MLPETAKTGYLDTYHEDYKDLAATWQTILDLREGAPALLRKLDIYVPKRPGEAEDLYRLRLKKFAYTPVMSDAIREFVSKLASSPVSVAGLDNDAFWESWLQRIDGAEQDQHEFLTTVFSSLLYFGRILVAVDLPALETESRSRAEDPEALPYLTTFEAYQVTNWGHKGEWFIVKQWIDRSEPLSDPKHIQRWTVYTSEEVGVYETEVILGTYGMPDRYKLNNGTTQVVDNAGVEVPLVRRWVHNFGYPPVSWLVLPKEQWVGLNVYLKQLQHTMIEQSWTDAGTIAGTIQRVFTPTPPAPVDDPRYAYEVPDYSDLKADNQHILIGNGFQFVESSGAAIGALSDQLKTIEGQIKALVSMGWMSGDASAVAQSGVSKTVDFALLKDAMAAYGLKVAKLYEKCLQMVSTAAGLPDVPSVSGLDSHEVDNLDAVVQATSTLVTLLPYLPPTAWKVWIGKLASLMVGSTSAEVQSAIQQETDNVRTEPIEPTNDDRRTDPSSGAKGRKRSAS